MKPKKPQNETSEQRFKRLAESRTKAILDKIRLLENCSNKRLYSYSQSDVDKIFGAINKQLKKAKLKFNSHKREEFKL